MRCRPSVLPLAAALAAAAVAAHASPVLPSENQMSLLDWDMTAFVHFSITTFTGSQAGTQDPTKFAPNPTTLNVSQWVSTVKAMGAPVAVLTSKHEAGFCLWPTNTSSRNFSIAASPTVGQRDLIREFTTECRKQGIMPGLYFTPTDPYTVDVLGHAQGSEANNAVQLAQMEELTSNYGELAYIWFDHYCQHAGKQHPQWVCPLNGTFKGLAEIVRRNQPQAVILGQDTKQVGAEGGYAPYPLYYQCDTRLNTSISNCVDSQSGRDMQGKNIGMNGSPTGRFWKSPESDCSIYDGCHPWFASDSAPVQSVATAIQHFELTVGRGTEYILNLPPSKLGIIGPREAKAAADLGAEVAQRYGCGHARPCNPAAAGSKVLSAGQSLTLKLPNSGVASFNRVWLGEEAATDGQRVASYKLEILHQHSSEWMLLESAFNGISSNWKAPAGTTGATIGLRHLDSVNVSATSAQLMRLTVLAASGPANVTMMVFSV